MLPISICIPTKNEEKNLPGCLASLKGHFNDIVLVDSGSEDGTLDIAQDAGLTILNFDWNGQFPKKRNWALENHCFAHDWVLFLDADERITPAFLGELEKALQTNENISGFWLHYDNWFMGQKLLHGDRMRKLALFRASRGRYEKFPENWWSHLDMEVHEHPVLDGNVGSIDSPLEHHDFRGLSSYISKHNQYSDWELGRYEWLHSKKATTEHWQQLTSRQQFKYRHLPKWWFSHFYFSLCFIAKRGFLDGKAGYRFAKMKQRYFQEVRLKILESERVNQTS